MSNPRPYADAPRLPEGEELDLSELFEGSAMPVELEVGPGRGGFVFERLDAEARIRMVGLEIRRKWATIVDDRLRERGYGDRARVFSEDIATVLPRLRDASLARVFVHFPDPWWKKRHRKRLVVTPEFAAGVARILAPTGELFVQTDVPERADEYERVLEAEPGLEPAAPSGPRIAENPFQARSPREHRAVADGLPVYRLLYRRACS